MSVGLFAIFAILISFFVPEVSRLLGSNELLLPNVMTYVKILTPSLVFFMLINLGLFIIRLDGSPKFAMGCSLVPAACNIIGDFVLIGVLDMGIVGAVVATSLSYVLGGVMVIIYMFKFSKKLKLIRLKLTTKGVRLMIENILYICKLGFPGLLSEFAIALMALIGNFVFLSYLGENGVAAFAVACYYFPIIFMINNAVAQSAQPIINYNLLIDRCRADQTMALAVKTSIFCGLIITALMIFFAPIMVGLFLDDSSIAYQIATDGIPYFALGFVFFAVNVVYAGYFQSVGEIRKASIITVLRGYVFPIILFMVLPSLFSVTGIWLAVPVAEVATFIVLFFLMRNRSAVKAQM